MLVEVDADYSQYYLRTPAGDFDMDALDDPSRSAGLAHPDDAGNAMLIALRQFGRLPVDVEVLDSAPEPEGRTWQDVVEFSLPVHASLALTGWDPFSAAAVLPVRPATTYRVRYAVADADRADDTMEPPFPERYRLRLWPQAWAPPQQVRVESAMGQHWAFQPQAEQAKQVVAVLPAGQRTRAIVDIGLREHPETAARIARGETAYRAPIVGYAQKIHPPELDGPALLALVDERARALSG